MRRLLAPAVALLLLAGCRVDFGVRTDIRARGSGTLALSIAADGAATDELTGSGLADLARLLSGRSDELGAENPLATSIAEFEAAGWSVEAEDAGVRIAHGFDEPAELEALADDLAPIVTKMRLVRDVGIFRSHLRFSAAFDFGQPTLEAVATSGLDAPPTSAELERVLQQSLSDTFGLEVEVRMAGDAVVETATIDPETEDGNLVWNLRPGDQLEFDVTTNAWNALGTGLFLGAVVFFGAAIALGAIWLARYRRAHDR